MYVEKESGFVLPKDHGVADATISFLCPQMYESVLIKVRKGVFGGFFKLTPDIRHPLAAVEGLHRIEELDSFIGGTEGTLSPKMR